MVDYSFGIGEGEGSPSVLLENDEISAEEEGFMIGELMARYGDELDE